MQANAVMMISLFIFQWSRATAAVPSNILQTGTSTRLDLIVKYFFRGFTYPDSVIRGEQYKNIAPSAKAELDSVAVHWNLHSIRRHRNAKTPTGKQDLMYFVPAVFGGHNFCSKVNREDVQLCCEMYASQRQRCSQDFETLARLLKPDLQEPVNEQRALQLFRELIVLDEENV